MKCGHCGVGFHAEWTRSGVYWKADHSGFDIDATHCPACDRYLLRLEDRRRQQSMIYPQSGARLAMAPNDIPANLYADYIEANEVLPISSKASAALSRRCLQGILNAAGYAGRDLNKQIDALLLEPDTTKAIPSSIRSVVDAVRNFGNFSAHPIDDKTTFQIIDVDPEEADWCLEIVEELFDHFYIRPAATAARKAALDAKLAAANKPPSKS